MEICSFMKVSCGQTTRKPAAGLRVCHAPVICHPNISTLSCVTAHNAKAFISVCVYHTFPWTVFKVHCRYSMVKHITHLLIAGQCN